MASNAKRRTRTKAPGVYRSISGSYEIAYRDSDGRLVFRVVDGGFKDAKDARAEIVTKLKHGEPVRSTKTTFVAYAETVMAGVRGRPKTIKAHRYQLRRHLLPRFGNRKLADLSTDDVATLVAEMQRGIYFEQVDGRYVRQKRDKGYSGWTISQTLSTLSLVMRRAKRKGLIQANPVIDLESDERPSVDSGGEKRVLEHEEITRLLEAATPTFRPFIALLVFTGLRFSEALGLRWEDINTDTGWLHVRHQLDPSGQLAPLKTKAARRDIEIDAGFGTLLRQHKLASLFSGDADFVFPGADGDGRKHRSAGRGIERAVKKAGLGDGVSAHTLRHTFASRLILSGLDPVRVSKRLGHKNAAFTLKTYSHAFEQARHAEEMRERMGEINSPLLAAVNGMATSGGNRPQPGGSPVGQIKPIRG
jgi:integrase